MQLRNKSEGRHPREPLTSDVGGGERTRKIKKREERLKRERGERMNGTATERIKKQAIF